MGKAGDSVSRRLLRDTDGTIVSRGLQYGITPKLILGTGMELQNLKQNCSCRCKWVRSQRDHCCKGWSGSRYRGWGDLGAKIGTGIGDWVSVTVAAGVGRGMAASIGIEVAARVSAELAHVLLSQPE